MSGLFDSHKVSGEGPVSAQIVFVGEAPGKDESEAGRPFVGKAGRNFDEFLEFLGCLRKDVYITNAVKYRPYKVSSAGTVSNRTPSFSELTEFRPELIRELVLINPEIIVTLGNSPLRSILNNNSATVGELHGYILNYEDFRIFPLYHPASIIYNPGLKEKYLEDLYRLKIEICSLENTIQP